MRKAFAITAAIIYGIGFLVITGAMAILFIAALNTPAKAATALWEDQGVWSIHGDTDEQACSAFVEYDTGRNMSIVFLNGPGENVIVSVVITGVQVQAGADYKAIVAASTGASGTLPATAPDDESIVFSDVNEHTVRALADAKEIFIQGLGIFELKGSKAAMKSAWHCYEALNSY